MTDSTILRVVMVVWIRFAASITGSWRSWHWESRKARAPPQAQACGTRQMRGPGRGERTATPPELLVLDVRRPTVRRGHFVWHGAPSFPFRLRHDSAAPARLRECSHAAGQVD